jgi:hypothetical protein
MCSDETTPHEPDDALIAKVRKLLAMAERSGNPNEADAFSRKAAELIAAHRLSPEHLRETADDPLAVRTFAMGRGAYVRARISLLQAVADANGCRVVFAADRDGTTAYVAGFRRDLDTTEVLYSSLHAQAAGRMANVHRPTGAATQRWRRSFLFGYAHEVALMLASSRAEAERAVAGRGDWRPALRSREQRVAEFAATKFGRVVSARAPSAATLSGWNAGRTAAQRADLGRRGMPGRLALERGA